MESMVKKLSGPATIMTGVILAVTVLLLAMHFIYAAQRQLAGIHNTLQVRQQEYTRDVEELRNTLLGRDRRIGNALEDLQRMLQGRDVGVTAGSSAGAIADAVLRKMKQRPSGPRKFSTGSAAALDPDDIADAVVARLESKGLIQASHDGPSQAVKPAVISEEQLAALDRAHGVIDDALATGRWTENDVVRLRELTATLRGVKEAQELIGRLFMVINRGELIPDDSMHSLF